MEQADLETLRQTFLAEVTDHLDDLEAALLALEELPGEKPLLRRMFEVTHTFKGAAGSLGFHAIAQIAHAMEDVIECLERKGAPISGPTVNLLLSAIDAARGQLRDVLAGIDQLRPAGVEILPKLSALHLELAEEAPPRSTSPRESIERPDEGVPEDVRLRSVRIDVAKLDRMTDLLGEIAVFRGQLKQQLRAVGGRIGATLQRTHEQTERFYAELEDVVRTARMVPIGPWLHQYARAVRDVAHAHGKAARLVIEGADVEVDMAVAERLRDPLTHLVRNAIDHGIEPPELRRSRGKDPVGTITLSAWHEGRGLMLRIADDGAGLRRDRIVARAQAREGAPDPKALSPTDIDHLVLEPGISTADQISELSGRGMGLSIVRQRVEALRGAIGIESTEGVGASFTLRLPLTLATIEGLSVTVGDDLYVIPLDAVIECLHVKESEFEHGSLLNVRGRTLPCVELRVLFDLPGPAPSRQSVVVIGHGERPWGLVVDSLQGEGRVLIRSLGSMLRRIPGVVGSTILGDGRVALILDVATLKPRALPILEQRSA